MWAKSIFVALKTSGISIAYIPEVLQTIESLGSSIRIQFFESQNMIVSILDFRLYIYVSMLNLSWNEFETVLLVTICNLD
jgi:hypothetical protein